MSDCVFCEILAGRAEASFVYRDDDVAAFMDLFPITPGHLLVVPIEHHAWMTEVREDVAAHMFRVGNRLAGALRHVGVRCEGVNFFLADGEAAGQEVFHAHLHVLPRFAGDGFGFKSPPGYPRRAPREALDALARRLHDHGTPEAQSDDER